MRQFLKSLGMVALLTGASGCEFLYLWFPSMDPALLPDAGETTASSASPVSGSSTSLVSTSMSATSSGGVTSTSLPSSSSGETSGSTSTSTTSTSESGSSSSGVPLDLTHSTVEVAPDGPLVANGAAAYTVTVTLKDGADVPLSGLLVQLTASGTGNVISSSVRSSSQGLAALTLASTRAEVKTLTVTVNPSSDAVVLTQHPTATFVPGPVAKLVFTDEPASRCQETASACTAGVNLAAVAVSIMDQYDNVVTSASSSVTLSLGTHPLNAVLNGTLTQNAVDGVATFSDLNLQRAGNYTLAAKDSDITGTFFSQAFVINAAAPAKLGFVSTVVDGIAGEDLGPVRVGVQDQFGNTVTTATHPVTLVLGTAPAGAQLLVNPSTVAAVAGVATFTGVIIKVAGTLFTLAATAEGLTRGESNPFAVNSSAAVRVVFDSQPVSTRAGQAITPPVTVLAVDRQGNTVTTASGTVTLTVSGGDESIGLTGNTAALAAGVATFSQLKINQAGTHVLVATHPTLGSANSNPFEIQVGAPHALTLLRGDAQHGTVGTALAQPLVVGVTDDLGNAVASANVIFEVTAGGGSLLDPGTSGGTGTTQKTVQTGELGEAAVTLVLGTTAGSSNNTVTVLSSGLVGSGLQIRASADPGEPATLTRISGDAQTGTVGVALAQPFVVDVADAFSNKVPNVAVQFSITSGGGTLSATSVDTNAQGRASATLTLGPQPGSNGVEVSVPGVAQVVQFTATAQIGAAARLAFPTTPLPSGTAASPLSNVKVLVQDAQGNAVTNSPVLITLSLGDHPDGAVLGGTLSATSSNGEAVFTNVTVNKSGNYTLIASAPSLSNGTSPQFRVLGGAPHHLAFDPQPMDAMAGTDVMLVAAVKDALGNTSEGATGVWIHLELESGPVGVVFDPITILAVEGLALFQGVRLTQMGTYSFRASADTFTDVVSDPFEILPNIPGKLVFIAQPTTGIVGRTLAEAKVAVQDDYGNPVDDATNLVTMALENKPTGAAFVSGSTTQVAAVAGVASFTNLAVDQPATAYTLKATSGTLLAAVSAAIQVTDGPAKLGFVSQPRSGTAGVKIPLDVSIQTYQGSTWILATDKVELTLVTRPEGATFPGGAITMDVNAQDGVAKFPDFMLHTAGTYTVRASSGTLQPVLSNPFTIRASSAVKVVIEEVPRITSVGEWFSVLVRAIDSFGNHANYTGAVSLRLHTNPTGATDWGEMWQNGNGTEGLVRFDDVMLDRGGSGFRVSATAPTLDATPVISEPIDVQNGELAITEFNALGANEFVEVRNPGQTIKSLLNRRITNRAGVVATITQTSLPGHELPPGDYAKGVPAEGSVPADADFIYTPTLVLADSGDVLRLFDGDPSTTQLLDVVDFGPDRVVTSGSVTSDAIPAAVASSTQLHHVPSDELDTRPNPAVANDSGSEWCLTFRLPDTAGAPNQFCHGTTVGSLVINEILYDPVGDVGDQLRWLELRGAGGAALEDLKVRYRRCNPDLEGCVNPDVEFNLNARLPVDGYLVIADADAAGTQTQVPNADMLLPDFEPANNHGHVRLLSGTTTLDLVGWGANPGAGNYEGDPAVDVLGGHSLARSAESADTDDNSVDLLDAVSPTPGEANGARMGLSLVTPDNSLENLSLAGVEIHGQGILNGARATFGYLDATGCTFSSGVLTCTAPAQAMGKVFVKVINPLPDVSSAWVVNGFRYTKVLSGNDQVRGCTIHQDNATVQDTALNLEGMPIRGQVIIPGLTDIQTDAVPDITSDVGYGPEGTDPRVDTRWRFFPGVPDPTADFTLDRDTHVAYFSPAPSPGSYSFVYRFSRDDGVSFTYCDTDGSGSDASLDFQVAKLGTLTVQ